MKKKILISLALVSVITGFSALQVHAQGVNQASVTAHASAEVIEAITATEVAIMNFGRFFPETNGGEIRLTPDGIRTTSGNVTLSGGSYNQAIFHITGHFEATVTIALPSGTAYLTNMTNGKTMEVTEWEANPSLDTGTGVLKDGKLTLNVGATLKVGSMNDNPVGLYSGTYAITVSYN